MELGVNLKIPANAELITAPRKKVFASKHYEHIIGIGKDHTASLIIDEDALKELRAKGGQTDKVVDKLFINPKIGDLGMTAKRLKEKYRGLWYDVYQNMIEVLIFNMNKEDVEEYKKGKKNCRIITVAHNAAFLACSELDKRLSKIS